ncbi:P-loop containing nucleoside triphosphate hydrolase protein [Trichoderma longibrachiatum ATCC 18648]|uniref:P-loop containing nucleoside triphosphate hydrolase protein n=1 Tax=Trichoderma longibrachiatum ATCC 18648 TaxID=983965 RepID=A0A2T4C621_TRILO|nr:P-loop containing nucleoside triphosphate hydrolase protein [Trichoderma longibrachiatum ATCC 18648]
MVQEKDMSGKQEESLFVEGTLGKEMRPTPEITTGSPSADLANPEDDVEHNVFSLLSHLTAGDVDLIDEILSSDYEVSEAEAGFAEDNCSDEVQYSGDDNQSDPEDGPVDGDVSDQEDDSDFEIESDSSSSGGEEEQDKPAKRARKTDAKTPRRKPAMNAREFVARLHEEEDRQYAKKMEQEEKRNASGFSPPKRKPTETNKVPFKALKMGYDGTPSKAGGIASTSNDGPLVPMEPIKATTHAQQFAQIKAQIPKNSDTRRKNSQEKDLRQAAKLFGYKRVEADNGRWKLKGMETALEPYQLTAVAWMVKRELSRSKPFGGLLADSMGMGKTMMSLACIMGNQADTEHKKEYCNATLVVVPNKTFGKQWEDEARKHCKSPVKDKIFVYDRNDGQLMERCKKSFIVITTYHEIIFQFPRKSTISEAKKKSKDKSSFKRSVASLLGPIFKVKWYRIILDEAHVIKNPDSSKMYPYLRFTKCESTLDPRLFNSTFTHDGHVNAEFEALISLVMYRRTLKDEFLGYKIIDLPEKVEADLLVPLSSEEQCIVNAVKDFYEGKIALLESGELDQDEYEAAIGCLDLVDEVKVDEAEAEKSRPRKSSGKVSAFAMRIASQVRRRQAISHTFCIEKLLRYSLQPVELKALKDALQKVGPTKQTILEQIRNVSNTDGDILKDNYRLGTKTVLCPYEDCDKALYVGEDVCTLRGKIDSEDKKGDDSSRDRNNATVHLEDDRNGFLLCGLLSKGASVVPSTRLTATMAVVLTWLHDVPDDKILMFTQFKATAKVLGCMLRALEIGFVYYYGGLTLGQKRKALEAIKTNGDIKIMVSTLKAGGQCLNLTVANRVVIIDPWWNKTAEQQAFGRVTRIGQEKITHLVNIRVKEEFDEYVHERQIEKAEDVDYTLQDDGHTPRVVSELELQRAFEKKKKEKEDKKKRKDKKKKKRVEKAMKKKTKAAAAQK